mgnify:CR=1 FL=1
MKKPCRPADICAHLGDDYDRYLGAIVPPLFQNTLFTRKHEEHGYSYSRINNPTIEILEKKLAALEHAPAARVFASGMAAITATLSSLLHSGGHVLALRSAYHPVIGFLDTEMKKYGVEVTYLERFTPEEIERSLRPNTRVFYLESPSSNIFRVLPLREIAAQAHACGAVTVIDLGNAVVPEAAGTGNRLQHPFRDQISRRPQRRAGRRGAGQRRAYGRSSRRTARFLGRVHGPVCRMAAHPQPAHFGGAHGAAQRLGR